jgi:hypothetical protein
MRNRAVRAPALYSPPAPLKVQVPSHDGAHLWPLLENKENGCRSTYKDDRSVMLRSYTNLSGECESASSPAYCLLHPAYCYCDCTTRNNCMRCLSGSDRSRRRTSKPRSFIGSMAIMAASS